MQNMKDKRKKPLVIRDLADKIRKRRFEIDLSQLEVSHRVDCNINSYGEIERGHVDPSFTMLIRIAKALLISPKDLMPE